MGGEERIRTVVVVGPTGIGKTSLAIRIAREFGGEIVGADSMQIYRYMDIGTAKPTPAEQAAAPHHMIDMADPDEPYDAARYTREARAAVREIHGRGRLPVVAGGTGLYVKSLLHGIFPAGPRDDAVRERLRHEVETKGAAGLHERLAGCDPESARRIHPNDAFRIVRALEVFDITGRPISAMQADHGFTDRPFEFLLIGLSMERDRLYDRIDRRVDRMLADGLEQEVEGLLARGYPSTLQSMQAIGYRHMADCLEGRIDRPEAERTLKRDTRRFAKRQYTWFNADPDVTWHHPGDGDAVARRVAAFLPAKRPETG